MHKYVTGVCYQYHVRIWKINDNLAIGAVHYEIVRTDTFDINHIGGLNTWENDQTPGHVVTSFENGEDQVRSSFVGSSGERIPTCWTATANAHSLSNGYTREYWDSTRTTKMFTAQSGSTATTIDQKRC